MPHPEIPVQHDAINAVIAAAQEILIERAQPVTHEGDGTDIAVLISSCPEGASFSQPSLRKSVVGYLSIVLFARSRYAIDAYRYRTDQGVFFASGGQLQAIFASRCELGSGEGAVI